MSQEFQLFRVFSKKNTPHIKFVGVFKGTQNDLQDEPLIINMHELNKTNICYSADYKDYQIIGDAYICNIPHPYIVSNNKYPVYYLNFTYMKQFVKGKLFGVYVYFDIDKESKEKLIKHPQTMINTTISGKFSYKFIFDESTDSKETKTNTTLLNKILNNKFSQIENDVLKKYFYSGISLHDIPYSSVKSEIDTLFDEYKKTFDAVNIDISDLSINYIINLFKNICNLSIIPDLISFIISVREEERKLKYKNDIFSIENLPQSK